MCLIATSKIKKIKRAIVCFKLLDQRYNGTLFSPYKYVPYEIGETKTVPYFTDGTQRKLVTRKEAKVINAGLHAFTSLNYALQQQLVNQVVVRCSIPKGTPYILGTDHEIVALKLVIKEIVEYSNV